MLLSDAYVSVAAVSVVKEERIKKFDMGATYISRSSVPVGLGGPGSLLGHKQPLTWLTSSAARPLLAAMPVITAYHTDSMPILCFGQAGTSGEPEDSVAAAYSLPVSLKRGL
jgi:hypothetical protein